MTTETALITGASSGIGEAFAREFARQGKHLILVARSQAKLETLAEELRRAHQINVTVLTVDLSVERAAQEVSRQTKERGLTVEILVNNAGFGSAGELAGNDKEQEHRQVMTNVTTVVDLIHEFLPEMVAKKRGTILNVASQAAFQPVPYMAVYGATKAFVLSLSEALWEENRKHGVKVLGLCPGATRTNFFEAASSKPVGMIRTSEQVVQTAMRALKKNRSYVIDGRANALLAGVIRFLPRKLVAKVAGQSVKM